MNIILTILLIFAGIIVLLLLLALFMKKEHYVKREIIINAFLQKVFELLKLLKNQNQFNKWATADKQNRKEEFKGTDGTVITIPMAEKKFPKDMDESLSTLKNFSKNNHHT